MLVEKKLEVKKKYGHRLKTWAKFDQFLIAMLQELAEQMNAVNQSLGDQSKQLAESDDRTSDVARDVSDLIASSLESGDEDGLGDLVNVMEARLDGDEKLKTLLGMISFNVAIRNRLQSFIAIAELIDQLNMPVFDPEKARALLLKYGTDGNDIWRHARHQCRSVKEFEMLDRATGDRKVDKAS